MTQPSDDEDPRAAVASLRKQRDEIEAKIESLESQLQVLSTSTLLCPV